VVKICDLGWAVYSPLPRDTLCGTPIYASPELVEKKKYNSKIDVWNVGVMAYELLCGRVPFEIRSEEDLYKVVLEEIHFPKSIPISDFCKDFINNCLKKQPEKRKTITELLEHIFLNENIS
jgi:serine/threonine protein kinase